MVSGRSRIAEQERALRAKATRCSSFLTVEHLPSKRREEFSAVQKKAA